MAEQILYVVFHGLMSLVEDQDAFHAFLVQMDDHTVAVGHWLTEIPLEVETGSVLELQGVADDGTAGLHPDQNLILTKPVDLEAITASQDCYARIDMPKPRKCYSYFVGDASGLLTGEDQPESQYYAAVQVFEYAVPGPDFTQVGLFQDDVALWMVRGYALMSHTNNDKITVLHIYNEPAVVTDPQHSRDEFLKGSALFGADVGLAGGPDVCLEFPGSAGVNQVALPEGLLVQELTPLVLREGQVFNILNPLRAGVPAPEGKPIGGGHYCGWMHIQFPD